jgi:hypothetical protein
MLLAVRILQIIAISLGLLGAYNAEQFGSRLYGDVPVDWLQSLYAILPALGGVVSWFASHYLNLNVSTPAATELLSAIAGWLASKNDLTARRRLLLAVVGFVESLAGWEEAERLRAAMATPEEVDSTPARKGVR